VGSGVKSFGRCRDARRQGPPSRCSFVETNMEFLPIRYAGERVYAGFWRRFCALWVDAFIVILPVRFFLSWLEGFDRTVAIVIMIPSAALLPMYHVYFNARYGGTLGKLAVGIRVTRPDGGRIGWTEAIARSAVDMVFALVGLCIQVWALAQISGEDYSNASGFLERGHLLKSFRPSWLSVVSILSQVWVWSEVVVLLLNRRKRALHDFIAGTIVIRKEFADISIIPGPPDATSDGDWANASRRYVRGESDD
jgi:uncharacterized RDD family membrane protein YckC